LFFPPPPPPPIIWMESSITLEQSWKI